MYSGLPLRPWTAVKTPSLSHVADSGREGEVGSCHGIGAYARLHLTPTIVLTMTTFLRAALPVALLMTLSLAACAPAAEPYQEPVPAESTEATAQEPEVAAGTRENPIPIDTLTEYSTESVWRYSLGAATQVSTEEIMAFNPFNEIPDGSAVVTAPFHIVAKDGMREEGAEPWLSLDIAYVSSQGNSFPASDGSVTWSNPIVDIGVMYAGAEGFATVAAAVPIDAIPGGVWRVSSSEDPSSAIFIQGVE